MTYLVYQISSVRTVDKEIKFFSAVSYDFFFCQPENIQLPVQCKYSFVMEVRLKLKLFFFDLDSCSANCFFVFFIDYLWKSLLVKVSAISFIKM